MTKKIHMISHTGGVGEKPKPGGVFSFGAALRASMGDRLNWTYIDKDTLTLNMQDLHKTTQLATLGQDRYTAHYAFANETMWFVLHKLWQYVTYSATKWKAYIAFQEQVVQSYLDSIPEEDPLCFVNDYQMALMPKLIRKHRPKATVALFWHIPFMADIPSAKSAGTHKMLYARNAMKTVVAGMLGANAIGFHCEEYVENFFHFVEKHLFRSFVVNRSDRTVTNRQDGSVTKVVVVPLGIDYKFWSHPTEDSLPRLNEGVNLSTPFFLSVGRMEPIKGYWQQLGAINRFFEKYGHDYIDEGGVRRDGWLGRISFVVIAQRSRKGNLGYDTYFQTCEHLIEHIDQTWKTPKWSPIYRLTEPFTHSQLRTFFRDAAGCIICSLADGLNLVAKEYSATNRGRGVLLMTKQTGAYPQLKESVLPLDPYNPEQMADQMLHALLLDEATKKRMATSAHKHLSQDTIAKWWELWGTASGLTSRDEKAA